MSGAVVIAAYNSYCFGITDFRWLQALQDVVSIRGTVHVSTGKCPIHVGCSWLINQDYIFIICTYCISVTAKFKLKFLKWCIISQQPLLRKHSCLDHSYPGGLVFTS